MNIAVVGLGKIGLPLAVQAASAGVTVVGVDIDPRVVSEVNGGRPPFPGESELDQRLADVVTTGRLTATADYAAAIEGASAVLVVVPLVVDADAAPDFRAIDAATAQLGPHLKADTLVSYETTLPVGTTRDRFAPALAAASGIPIESLLVCHSPERVYSGRVFADLRRYPKLVGGINAESGRRAVELYRRILEFDPRPDLERENGVWDLRTAEAAELAKLLETTYRDVNIALANEFARYADRIGLDFDAVAEASNSQPFSHLHRPGIAVGGHCIPVYPRFYLAGDPQAELPRIARAVNEAMPGYGVDLVAAALPDGLRGMRVVILGVSYRGGVKEAAFSGATSVARELAERGADVTAVDPLYSDSELEALGFVPHSAGSPVDVVILQADHAEFAALGSADFPGVRVVLDGRRALRSESFPDATFLGIGRGGARP